MELCSSHTRFTFLDEKVPVELTPAHRTSNGWTIASITSPKVSIVTTIGREISLPEGSSSHFCYNMC